MSFVEVIARRRDGLLNSAADLQQIAAGASSGSIPDYQLAAWLMAAFLNPLSREETADLTLAMASSGQTVELSGLPKPWVDKHSTGGVGDKTTLVLAPLLAACGLTVVKMSGRGLGITGGTVDKLSAIPGFRLDFSPRELKDQAGRIGIALTGQSPDLAPADKALYALRDVTGTVASIPLIVSSILSKKIAGGAETIVLDVKCGSGGFMPDLTSAMELADALADVGLKCGLKIKLAITDMDQPLGEAVGNALEVQEALDVLGQRPLSPNSMRFKDLCMALAGHTLVAAGLTTNITEAQSMAEQCLSTGRAWAKAQEWISAQGGRLTEFKLAPNVIRRLEAKAGGWISTIDAGKVGQIVLDLGGGRATKDDAIDLQVGLRIPKPIGAEVSQGEWIAEVHASSDRAASDALQSLQTAIAISSTKIEPKTLVLAEF
jgi:pyrimidine-nucleoside phosphorylase